MTHKSPIAVVGMAGLFPGARDLDTFWHNIIHKISAAGEIPDSRWIPDLYQTHGPRAHPDKAYSTRACLLDDYRIKPGDVNLDADLLAQLDPLHHLVLGAGKAALANCNLSSIKNDRIGISLAAIALPTSSANLMTCAILENAFEEKLFNTSLDKTALTPNQCAGGRVTGYPASLLAKAFDIRGTAFTLDAACASSIYAVKIACDELWANEADAMIAGGVSRPDNIFTQVGFSQLRALSPSGRCAAFDESADGLVVGEGAGLLVLKRLEDALAHGDFIYGLVAGIGLSNDMSGNLLAPDKEGQIRAMKSAYEVAGWQPTDVDFIECHGAGTPVGDLVELQSLHDLWKGLKKTNNKPCAIGSVKSVVGHLLTGAGAAGMIKTLLAFKHKTLPPSANFTRPSKNSPLVHNSPFKVLTEPEPWATKDSRTPRRAAVSAFGFGGINGHLLLEEWVPGAHPSKNPGTENKASGISVSGSPGPAIPMAIVGMGAAFGNLGSLREFQEVIFKGTPAMAARPANRWKGCDALVAERYGLGDLPGAFVSDLIVHPGRFHIPPNEISDMLPQQLLMLQIAASALTDAGLPLRGKRPDMGAIIGIGFDFETTNFYLRWNLENKIRQWNTTYHLNLSPEDMTSWREELLEECGPPLTASRTLGNLGSIVASRISREFQFGGPSYTVSNEEASGLTALKLAMTALTNREVNAMLVGAVDFAGDVRHCIARNLLHPYSPSHRVRPFDRSADGNLPGEGAVALVIKRLDDAIADHHRIYAVIKATGKAGAGRTGETFSDAYLRSLEATFSTTDISRESISLIETHGTGTPNQDTQESVALNRFFRHRPSSFTKAAMGSVKPLLGHTGAASGLASLAKTVLCLYQEILPPLPNYTSPKDPWDADGFHMPKFTQYWVRNREDGPRRALSGAVTVDGSCVHVLLEEMTYTKSMPVSQDLKNRMALERKKPAGWMDHGLFVVCGKDNPALIQNLDLLLSFISSHPPSSLPMEALAAKWHQNHVRDFEKSKVLSLVATTAEEIFLWAEKARHHILKDIPSSINGRNGFAYSPNPLELNGRIAFVYPGSGNHYLGMGRDLAVCWPEMIRAMDGETDRLKDQMLPEYYVPWRHTWENGWEKESENTIASEAKPMIFGQVVHGDTVTRVVNAFDVFPQAVIGYSLGESVGYFATHAWPDKGEMLSRIAKSDLFTTQLAGPCTAARFAWQVPDDQDVEWTVALVNRPAQAVRNAIHPDTTARLLIVNTYEQCVIGGRKPHVLGLISALNCDAVFLEGVVTVHCDAADPVAEAYRDLHVFPVTKPENITYYSCADGRSHELTSKRAADSICRQATKGFDFTQTIESAYGDGVRIFLEMGPHASCTGMIRSILKNKPHVALSACFRGENEPLSILKLLGTLVAEQIPVNLDRLYGPSAYSEALADTINTTKKQEPGITLSVGGRIPHPGPLPRRKAPENDPPEVISNAKKISQAENTVFDFIRAIPETSKATALAHEKFLGFSSDLQKNFARTLDLQARLLLSLPQDRIEDSGVSANFDVFASKADIPFGPDKTPPVYTREDCLEFAVGSVAKVLGQDFAMVDTYEKRVRLPDEPLMLVDRILSIEGTKGLLGPGAIVTEHDVLPGAWYLDGGKAPVCVSVEAGQADLFLCAYLGIDLKVKGERAYRLLDAVVEFHRSLPVPGETIRYEIEIDRFVKQGPTYLFFFSFKGYIGTSHLITMTDGCAGFFTEEEVKNSGGIILGEKDRRPEPGIRKPDVDRFVQFEKKTISDKSLDELRKGNPEIALGEDFHGITIPDGLKLPGGPMKLIDRILDLDPNGGRYGLGLIRAEADIHPDAWFLTCHFKDDMVMPGTLMYECCAHTLRVFIQQMGWISDDPGACYEPVMGVKSVLKCRGPVTPRTRHVHYEVEIKELGYGPEPYVIGDAHMAADGHRIVMFKNISLKLSHGSGESLRRFWEKQRPESRSLSRISRKAPAPAVVFDREKLLEFALGSPSKAFGEPYKIFDSNRFIARLPNPPLLMMSRVNQCGPEPWVLKPGGWVEAAYDVSENDWYFAADHTQNMPYVILLEIALQPCGWLAAYMGSALKSKKDLKFRNLDGKAVLHHPIPRKDATLTTKARCTQISSAGDMIIQQYEFLVLDNDRKIYEGNTTFGFFTAEAMAMQKGIAHPEDKMDPSARVKGQDQPFVEFHPVSPFTPEHALSEDFRSPGQTGLRMPGKALLMIDEIETYEPKGGAFGLGFVRAIKRVDPEEWFFKAHFYQDPVCPGSLGIESFLQALKFVALQRWGKTHGHGRFQMTPATEHTWSYRGQILPENKRVEVEVVITDIQEEPFPMIRANGYLKVDGKTIYEMKDYSIRILLD